MIQSKTQELLTNIYNDIQEVFSRIYETDKKPFDELQMAILYARYLKEELTEENKDYVSYIRNHEPRNYYLLNDLINLDFEVITNYNRYIRTKEDRYKQDAIESYHRLKDMLEESIRM